MQLQFPRGVDTPGGLFEVVDPTDRIVAYVLASSYERLHLPQILATLRASLWTMFSLSMAARRDSIWSRAQILHTDILRFLCASPFSPQSAQTALPKNLGRVRLLPTIVGGQKWIRRRGFGQDANQDATSILWGARLRHLSRAGFRCLVM
jgi:hypothetical protein